MDSDDTYLSKDSLEVRAKIEAQHMHADVLGCGSSVVKVKVVNVVSEFFFL